MFWRLWNSSSDCCAKEKECSDSDGKRWRSSKLGRLALEGARVERALEDERERESERFRGVEANDEVDMLGRVKTRGGCCRIRSKPEGPSPRSSHREDLQRHSVCLLLDRDSGAAHLGRWSYSEKECVIESSVCMERLTESCSGDSQSGSTGEERGLGAPEMRLAEGDLSDTRLSAVTRSEFTHGTGTSHRPE